MNKQEVLTELKEAYNECNSLFDAAYTLNQSTFTRTEFTRKVTSTMSEVAQTIGYVIGELEGEQYEKCRQN